MIPLGFQGCNRADWIGAEELCVKQLVIKFAKIDDFVYSQYFNCLLESPYFYLTFLDTFLRSNSTDFLKILFQIH